MSVKVRKLYGETWGLVIHHQGRRKQVAVGSKRAAEAAAGEVQLNLARGKLAIGNGCPTFAEYAPKWLEYVELRRAPRTTSRYRVLIDQIKPHLGAKPIDQISRGDIRDMLLRAYKGGAARATVELMHAVCSGVFHHAVDDGLIAHPPTVKVMAKLDLNKVGEEIRPLSAAEMAEALQAMDQAVRPIFQLLFETGCRIGEALALTWADVDFRNLRLTIGKTARHQEVRATTKTHTRRTIDMSDALCSMLQELLMADKEACLAQGIARGPVFHKRGRLLSDNTLRRKWDLACERIGIGHRRLHDIRHTTASVLLARGAPITYVAKLLGHSSPQITLEKYAHYMPTENIGAINLLGSEPAQHCAGVPSDPKITAKTGTSG